MMDELKGKVTAEIQIAINVLNPEHSKYAENIADYVMNCIPQWTPISEGLPKEDGEYITTVKVKYNGEIYVMNCGYYDSEWQYAHRVDVLAWMPMPKPYEVKNDE